MSPHTELLPETSAGRPPSDPGTLDGGRRTAGRGSPIPTRWCLPPPMVAATCPPAWSCASRYRPRTPGYLVFYTNYRSLKGRQLEQNPRAAAVIHWDALAQAGSNRGAGGRGAALRIATPTSHCALGRAAGVLGQARRASPSLPASISSRPCSRWLSASARRPPGHQGTERGGGSRYPETPALGRIPALGREPRAVGRRGGTESRPGPMDAVVTDKAGGAFETGPWTATRLQP